MSHRARLFSRGYSDSQLDSPRLCFKRALLLCLLTIIAPGSAQILMGNKWVGRLALTAWVALLGGAAYLIQTARVDREKVLSLLTDADALLIARAGIITIGVLWLVLFIDAWRLGHPQRLGVGRKIVLTGLNVAIIASAVGSTAYASQIIHVQRDVVKEVFVAKEVSTPLKGRYNILLLGSDSGSDRVGIRPDSMTIASIDAGTGKTVLISMPRNLQNVPFPEGSPMRQIYPYGFNCGSECLLNAVHTAAANRSDLYPGSQDPGLDATIDAVSGVSGLKINYYTMINMEGFRSLVNAVGGVTVDVKTRLAMFGKEDSWKNVYLEPGKRKLNGREALWYARSRVQSDDYTRMGRQKCLMSAMLHELSPQTVLLRATKILASGKDLLATSIPAEELGLFADLALKSRKEKVMTVSLVPPAVSTELPDYDLIHKMIRDTITKSEAKPTAAPETTEPTDEPTIGDDSDSNDSDSKDPTQRAANATDDLSSTC